MDKRTIFAFIITFLFLTAVGVYCFTNFKQLVSLQPNEVGDLIAGIGSILALFWLIFGYFQQGQELKENTIALKQQEAQLQEQAKQTKELAIFAKAQADAMRSLAKATEQSVGHDKSLAMYTKASNELSKKLIQASEKHAKATTDLVKSINGAAAKIQRR
ncbi:hypothetical protein ACOJR9_00095 [Alteromonas sp. A081]|uniref:hypothetical protein n=1 Tax=Alteromonas sp. A081 TaxID=3410269 RepID=UPI003B97DC59